MTVLFDVNRFQMKEFFSYPCTVCERVVEFEDRCGRKKGDEDIKEFFEDCLKQVETKVGRHLMDNKIAIKVLDTDTGNTFYVGYKDNIYCLGLCLNPYMKSTYTINLDKYAQ